MKQQKSELPVVGWPAEAETEIDFIAALSTIQEKRDARWIAGALQSMYAADVDSGPLEEQENARAAERVFRKACDHLDELQTKRLLKERIALRKRVS